MSQVQGIDRSIRAIAGIRVGDQISITGYRHPYSRDEVVVVGFSRWVSQTGYCMHLVPPLHNGSDKLDLAWADQYSDSRMQMHGVEEVK